MIEGHNTSELAWHFVREDRKLMDGNTVEPGYVYEVEPPIQLCSWGLHASVDPLHALRYAPGPVVCRVEVSGQIMHDSDKLVATRREVLWMADASLELRLFGCWCVQNTPLGDGRTVWDLLTDERSRRAVEVAERYAAGQATDRELSATWSAARSATWSAESATWSAESATWSAERSATRAAERSATIARLAAWSAESAARSASPAWAAARSPAWSAASSPAWSAAWSAQTTQLTKVLQSLAPGDEGGE